jgi:hypothetical protein
MKTERDAKQLICHRTIGPISTDPMGTMITGRSEGQCCIGSACSAWEWGPNGAYGKKTESGYCSDLVRRPR